MNTAQGSVLEQLVQIDGQTIDVGLDSWWVRVFSLQRVDDDVFVQLAALGTHHVIVTVSMPEASGFDSLVTLITSFLREPDGYHPQILDATPLSAWATLTSCADAVH